MFRLSSLARAITESHVRMSSLAFITPQSSPRACSFVPTMRYPIVCESALVSARIFFSEICGPPETDNVPSLGVGRPLLPNEM